MRHAWATAHIAPGYTASTLASIAEVTDGLFSLRAGSTDKQVTRGWQGRQTPLGTVQPKLQEVLFRYPDEAATAGRLAIKLVGQYLDEASYTPTVRAVSAISGWSAVSIVCPKVNAAYINAGSEERRIPVYVDMTEYTGSALYVAYHVLAKVDPSELVMRQFQGNDPQPFPHQAR